MIEFTTDEVDILALGWFEALLVSRIEGCPIQSDDLVLLISLTRSADGVLAESVQQSVKALENCAEFVAKYYIAPDLDRDDSAMLDRMYPMQQDSETVRQRFERALTLLEKRLK